MRATEMDDFTDLAALDHLLGQADRGIMQIVVADQRFDAFGFGCPGHGSGTLGIKGERFFAIDMLAGGDRGLRHLLMQEVGRGDRDDVH